MSMRVARPEVGEPLGPPPDGAEVDRDRAGCQVGGVDGERPAQDEPGEVAGPDVDELAGSRARRERRGVVRLQPLAGEDLPALDELGADEAHRQAAGDGSITRASRPSAVPIVRPSSSSSGATPGNASAIASARSPKTSVGS